MQIFHNPRCRKSRETLDLLISKKKNPDIFLYLEQKLTQKRLKEIVKMLDIKAEQLVRKTESIYKEQFKGKELTEAQWIKAMVENPKLIERPIVINKGKAAIGRPPENVLSII